MIQPFPRHSESGWRLFTRKQLRAGSATFERRALANQSAGNSPRQSFRYFPSKTPRTSISLGLKWGVKPGAKSSPAGATIS